MSYKSARYSRFVMCCYGLVLTHIAHYEVMNWKYSETCL